MRAADFKNLGNVPPGLDLGMAVFLLQLKYNQELLIKLTIDLLNATEELSREIIEIRSEM